MKKILMIAMLFLVWSPIFAQLTIGKSSGQIITERAISGNIVIVRLAYQIKDKKDGQIFGRNGQKEFGSVYSLGVITEAGLVLSEDALTPWAEDNNFKKIKDNYDPFISSTAIRIVGDSCQEKYVTSPLHIGKKQPTKLLLAQTDLDSTNGLEIDVEAGVREGWLIWLKTKNELEKDSATAITTQAINKKIEFKEGLSEIELDTPDNDNLTIGCIYVCPFFLGGGHLVYRLEGIAVKNDKRWILCNPFVGFQFDRQYDKKKDDKNDKQIREEEDIKLTPIASDNDSKEKSKKKRKNKK